MTILQNIPKKHKLFTLLFIIISTIGILILFKTPCIDINLKVTIIYGFIRLGIIILFFIIPFILAFWFLKDDFPINNYLGIFYIILTLSISTGFFLSEIVKKPIVNLIDPNTEIKRKNQILINQLNTKLKIDSIKIATKKNHLDSFKYQIKQIKNYNYTENTKRLNISIDSLIILLDSSLVFIKKLETETDQRIEENLKELNNIDSIYSVANQIKTDISKTISKNTWYKNSKYLEYIFAFIIGILSNIGFDLLSRRYRNSKGPSLNQ